MEKSGFIPVNGGRLYYEEAGEGPVLLLVHAGVANLRQWDPHVPEWSKHHRVVRYDTRGYGMTESEHVEFANHEDLGAVLDHVGAETAAVLGCSRGGSIAVNFAVSHPGRVTHLVEVAAGVGSYEPDLPQEVTDAIIAFDESTSAMAEAKEWGQIADAETAYWFDGPGQSPDRADPATRAMVREWIYSNYAAEKEEGISQPLDPSADTLLDRLTMPVLAVVGDKDEAYAIATMRYLAETVPNGRFELFENAAHLLNLEQPERFTRLVLDFVAT